MIFPSRSTLPGTKLSEIPRRSHDFAARLPHPTGSNLSPDRGRGLEAHGYVRNTGDLDLLVRLGDLDQFGNCLREFGYARTAETAIFSRWRSADSAVEDLDLLYVDPATFDKLNRDAVTMPLGELVVRVPSVAGMVALKLHAMRNQPDRRIRDSQDIQAILLCTPTR